MQSLWATFSSENSKHDITKSANGKSIIIIEEMQYIFMILFNFRDYFSKECSPIMIITICSVLKKQTNLFSFFFFCNIIEKMFVAYIPGGKVKRKITLYFIMLLVITLHNDDEIS